MSALKRFVARLVRSLEYAKRGFFSEDYDYAFLLGDIERKLRRMETEFKNTTVMDLQEDINDLRRMRGACSRLFRDEYFLFELRHSGLPYSKAAIKADGHKRADLRLIGELFSSGRILGWWF